MEELHENLDSVAVGLRALMTIQENYDADMWAIQNPPFEKFRHISLHIMMLAGTLAQLCEGGEHMSRAEQDPMLPISKKSIENAQIIADLLIHAAQLGNLLTEDLYSALITRYSGNARNFSPSSAFAKLNPNEDSKVR
jgi:hypothetical protein